MYTVIQSQLGRMNQTGPPEQMDWDGITQIRWRNEKTGLREKDEVLKILLRIINYFYYKITLVIALGENLINFTRQIFSDPVTRWKFSIYINMFNS